MADRIERLTNLLALLLETNEPLSLVQIASELDGQYPVDDKARRAAFERDKAALRDIGVPIDTEVVAGGPYAGQTRYRVDRHAYELDDLELAPDEMRALQVAVAAVRTDAGRDALWKLGGALGDEAPAGRRCCRNARNSPRSAGRWPCGLRSSSSTGVSDGRSTPGGSCCAADSGT